MIACTPSTTSVSVLCGSISSGLGGHGCVGSQPRSGPEPNRTTGICSDRGGVRDHDDDPGRARLEPPARKRDQHVDERRDDERVRQRPDDEQPLVRRDLEAGDEDHQALDQHQQAGPVVRAAQPYDRAEREEADADRDEENGEDPAEVGQLVRARDERQEQDRERGGHDRRGGDDRDAGAGAQWCGPASARPTLCRSARPDRRARPTITPRERRPPSRRPRSARAARSRCGGPPSAAGCTCACRARRPPRRS